MSDLQTFLADMALDSTKFAEFLRDPDAAMDRERLSPEDKAALVSGIPAMIASRLAAWLSYPPPYYTPVAPTYVTIGGMGLLTVPPPVYVSTPPLYVTAPPPLYITSTAHPVFVTMPPPLVMPAQPREAPAASTPPKTPPKRK